MPAYLIAEIEVTDPETYEEYRRQVAPTVEQYGGRVLVRGGAFHGLEGEWTPKRLVVIQFSDMDSLRKWYQYDEYERLKRIRQHSSTGKVLAVEGV